MGELSEKPLGEQRGDAPGHRLAEPALQVTDEPMEFRGEDASPAREVRGEKGWREASRKMPTQDHEFVDGTSLKRYLRSNPRSNLESISKPSPKDNGLVVTQSQKIPETGSQMS